MNCISRFEHAVADHPKRMALWTEKHGAIRFAELRELACRAQALFRARGVGPGDHVLVAALPGPEMFAALAALLGLGAPIVLIEPWMDAARIDHVVRLVRPKVFYTGWLGKLWAMRVPEIRHIPHWETAASLRKSAAAEFVAESLDPAHRALVAFSSGTSGRPKGALRTQGYLWEMHEILSRYSAGETGPELAIFPNVALFQLGTGRGAVLMPSRWTAKAFARIAALSGPLAPTSLACGPAFLKRLLAAPGFDTLRSFHVGGALTDCWIFEEAFARWKDAAFQHIYGGSEAEPVALADAREAVRRSRARRRFQTLYLGETVAEIAARTQGESIWVSGPNVCPEYLGDPAENAGVKQRDDSGRLWHRMGDRILRDEEGCWYAGRDFQRAEDFALEQRIYARLESSASFVARSPAGDRLLFGEGVKARAAELTREYPELGGCHETKIIRDRRHRARIDRQASLPKGIPWR